MESSQASDYHEKLQLNGSGILAKALSTDNMGSTCAHRYPHTKVRHWAVSPF